MNCFHSHNFVSDYIQLKKTDKGKLVVSVIEEYTVG